MEKYRFNAHLMCLAIYKEEYSLHDLRWCSIILGYVSVCHENLPAPSRNLTDCWHMRTRRQDQFLTLCHFPLCPYLIFTVMQGKSCLQTGFLSLLFLRLVSVCTLSLTKWSITTTWKLDTIRWVSAHEVDGRIKLSVIMWATYTFSTNRNRKLQLTIQLMKI